MDAVPFYRRPWFWTAAGAAAWGLLYAWTSSRSSLEHRAFVGLIDAILFLVGFAFSMAILAQFALPARTWRERRAAVGRLLLYFIGAHGPVVFIQHGQEVSGRGDRDRIGPGVLLVDTCSAVVLRTATRFTRAAGPGIVFLQSGERVAEAVDVRRQVRRLRARPPDPEAAADPTPSSQALTRDGVPVSADLSVTFMLDPGHNLAPREGQSANLPPYEVYPPSAERAVYGHAYAQHEDLPWTELPLRLVVDLWREEVKRYRLDDLIGSSEQSDPALANIRTALLHRLTPSSPARQESAAAARSPRSRELQVLQARGVRVMDISISNLLLPEEARQERLAAWLRDWTEDVRSRLSQAEPTTSGPGTPAKRRSRKGLAGKLTAGLAQRLGSHAPAPLMDDSLSLILMEAVRLCPSSHQAPGEASLRTRLESVASSLRPNGRREGPMAGGEPDR